jgi:hypothetical protein
MMRTWKLLGLSALAALLFVAPTPAGAQTDGVIPKTNAGKTLEEQIQALDTKLGQMFKDFEQGVNAGFKKLHGHIESLNNRLKTLEANDPDTTLKLGDARLRIERLEKQVEKLRLDMETLQKRTTTIAKYPPDEKATLDDIRAQLKQIEQTLNRLQATTNRTAFTNPPAPRPGRIVFTNHHPETLLFVLNNAARRVEPGQTITFNGQPAGTFTYEVVSPTTGTRGIQTRSLEPGETFIITARPSGL